MTDRPRRSHRHEVRPRLVWSGLAVAIAGSVVLAAGIMVGDVITSCAGVVVLLVGAVIAVRGGIMYDALPAAAFGAELHDVVQGRVHEGIAPGQMYAGRAATEDAVATSRRTAAVEHVGASWRRGGRDGPAGSLMLVLAATLVLAQWQLVHDSSNGLVDDYGETIAAIVLGLAGLRCLSANGVHRLAAAFALAAGVWLLVQGALFPHPNGALAGIELGCGALAVLAALAAGSEGVL